MAEGAVDLIVACVLLRDILGSYRWLCGRGRGHGCRRRRRRWHQGGGSRRLITERARYTARPAARRTPLLTGLLTAHDLAIGIITLARLLGAGEIEICGDLRSNTITAQQRR